MDTRSINEEYQDIGMELIKTEEALTDIANSRATIIFLSSQHQKKGKDKVIYAQCEKVAEKYKWGIPCDFTITVFEPNCARMTPDQKRILLFHELLHVGIEFCQDGSENYYIKPHDLEDFKLIIDKYGTEWSETDEN